MKRYHPNKNNTELYELMDKLSECNEGMLYYATKVKSNRLDKIEENASQIEKLAAEIQEKVKEMRRK